MLIIFKVFFYFLYIILQQHEQTDMVLEVFEFL